MPLSSVRQIANPHWQLPIIDYTFAQTVIELAVSKRARPS